MSPEELKAKLADLRAWPEGIAKWQALGPLILDAIATVEFALDRMTAERDEATKRAAEWEIHAQDFRDRVVNAEAERDEARASYGKLKAAHAELAADVSLLRRSDYPKMVATHKEIAHVLELDERATADALLTAIVIMRNQARATLDMQARARHMENVASLARAELETLRAAQTPRPIAEAPKDGTWVLLYWDATAFKDEKLPGVNRWDIGRCVAGLWEGEEGDEFIDPTHFLPLPLPVKP